MSRFFALGFSALANSHEVAAFVSNRNLRSALNMYTLRIYAADGQQRKVQDEILRPETGKIPRLLARLRSAPPDEKAIIEAEIQKLAKTVSSSFGRAVPWTAQQCEAERANAYATIMAVGAPEILGTFSIHPESFPFAVRVMLQPLRNFGVGQLDLDALAPSRQPSMPACR